MSMWIACIISNSRISWSIMRSLDAPLVERHKRDTARQLKFLELLPLNNYNVKQSAIQAGYSENTAIGNGKVVLKNALAKALALKRQELLAPSQDAPIAIIDVESKVLDIVGLTQHDIIKHYRFIFNMIPLHIDKIGQQREFCLLTFLCTKTRSK